MLLKSCTCLRTLVLTPFLLSLVAGPGGIVHGSDKPKGKGQAGQPGTAQATSPAAPAPASSTPVVPKNLSSEAAAAVLRHLLLSPPCPVIHRDLAAADLSGMHIRAEEVQGRYLGRANLTGAVLEGDFTGICLDDAVLYGTQVQGATGIDFARVRKHPFFEVPPDAEIGDMQFLDLEDGESWGDPPQGLIHSGSGHLLWLVPDQGEMWLLHPTGVRHRVRQKGIKPQRIAMDTKGNLWTAGEDQVAVGAFDHLLACQQGKSTTAAGGHAKYKGIMDLAPGADGHMFVTMAGGCRRFNTVPTSMAGMRMETSKLMKGPIPPGARMCAEGQEGRLFWIDQDEAALMVQGGQKQVSIALDPGSGPWDVVSGPGNQFWVSMPGAHQIRHFDQETSCVTTFNLPREGQEPRWVHRMAVAEDGSLCYTDSAAGLIGRISPEGDISEFRLPAGHFPDTIFRAWNGTMGFTLHGRSRIGTFLAVEPSIRKPWAFPAQALEWIRLAPDIAAPALEERKATPAPAVVSAEAPLPAPGKPDAGPSPARPNREQRHQLAVERMLRSEARLAPFLSSEVSETKADRTTEHKARTPEPLAPAKRDPLLLKPEAAEDLLLDLGVNLTAPMVRKILGDHGFGTNPDCGQFLSKFSTAGGLKSLLAQGWQQAEQEGLIGRIKVPANYRRRGGRPLAFTDLQGRCKTVCRLPGENPPAVGWTIDRQGAWRETTRFLVIAYRHKLTPRDQPPGPVPDQYEYDVFSIYPVPEDY